MLCLGLFGGHRERMFLAERGASVVFGVCTVVVNRVFKFKRPTEIPKLRSEPLRIESESDSVADNNKSASPVFTTDR